MKRHLIHFLLITVLCVCSAANTFAQVTVKGQVVDAENGEPLIGAAVTVEGTSQGSVTDIDGYFTQQVNQNQVLIIKYLGYKDFKHKVTQNNGTLDLGEVKMSPDAVALNDVVITSQAIARKTPVALTTIAPAFIEERIGTQDFPHILKATPSVTVSRAGGAYFLH